MAALEAAAKKALKRLREAGAGRPILLSMALVAPSFSCASSANAVGTPAPRISP